MSDTEYTPIEGVVMHLTAKAVLLKTLEGYEVWIPLSVIHEDDLDTMEVSDFAEIAVADWFVAKEGL